MWFGISYFGSKMQERLRSKPIRAIMRLNCYLIIDESHMPTVTG